MAEDKIEGLGGNNEGREWNEAMVTANMVALQLEKTSFDLVDVPLFPGIPDAITLCKIVPKFPWKDCSDALSKVNHRWKNVVQDRLVYYTRDQVQLFPGLSDEFTLSTIIPKLSWKDCDVLSKVNHCWRKAIQGHKVYDTRVRAHSTETLTVVRHILHNSRGDPIHKISLYSTRDDSWCELPPIPGLQLGFPPNCQCVALEGKIYILGGQEGNQKKNVFFNGKIYPVAGGSRKVYMLDLAGKGQWRQLASMLPETTAFGTPFNSDVIDGKICVFSGFHGTIDYTQVYNPEIDAWFEIQPMSCVRFRHQVSTVREELRVQDDNGYLMGEVENPDIDAGSEIKPMPTLQFRRHVATIREEFSVHDGNPYNMGHHEWFGGSKGSLLEAYHPMKNEWRLMESFNWSYRSEAVFTTQGKLHKITMHGIAVHEVDDNQHSRTILQPCSFTGIVPTETAGIQPLASVHVDGELLLLLGWASKLQGFASRGHLLTGRGRCLLRSRGFAQKDKEIVWEAIECPSCHNKCFGCYHTSCFNTTFLCSVQL